MKKRNICRPFLFFFLSSLLSQSIAQSDDYDDYVRQVLEDEREVNDEQYYGDFPHMDSDHLKKEQEATRKLEQNRFKEEQNRAEILKQEQVRLQREAEFEAELQKMSEVQKRQAMKQKKQDSRIVQRILKASSQKKHYKVLGLRNMEFNIGPFHFVGQSLGPWNIFQITPKHVKAAYRSRSKAAHPDKNKDNRATEAFIAVEGSAAVLQDESSKREYDETMRLEQRRQQKLMMAAVKVVANTIKAYLGKMWWVFRRLVGPFAFPIIVVTALIV